MCVGVLCCVAALRVILTLIFSLSLSLFLSPSLPVCPPPSPPSHSLQGEWTGDWSDDSPLWTRRMKVGSDLLTSINTHKQPIHTHNTTY